ncbi:SgcJ/EcaC family oxidoreductase [Neobacillus drentensis]|uniref:SgcJ/EcaC family oxidoreductase n=1 Tax=Neobacillus drentensis TaxID=220684 RepID=UPI002FFF41ED
MFYEVNQANSGEGDTYAACFTDDVDYVTFFGKHLKGRQSVAVSHQKLFDGIMRGSTMVADIKQLRFLSSDIAIIHGVGAIKMRWQKKAPKTRDSINTNVAVRKNGEWKFSAFHNCRIKRPNFIQKIFMGEKRKNKYNFNM